jgi:hypothetical protein
MSSLAKFVVPGEYVGPVTSCPPLDLLGPIPWGSRPANVAHVNGVVNTSDQRGGSAYGYPIPPGMTRGLLVFLPKPQTCASSGVGRVGSRQRHADQLTKCPADIRGRLGQPEPIHVDHDRRRPDEQYILRIEVAIREHQR